MHLIARCASFRVTVFFSFRAGPIKVVLNPRDRDDVSLVAVLSCHFRYGDDWDVTRGAGILRSYSAVKGPIVSLGLPALRSPGLHRVAGDGVTVRQREEWMAFDSDIVWGSLIRAVL